VTESARKSELKLIRDCEEKEELMNMRRSSIDEGGLLFKAKEILTTDLYPCKYVPPKSATEAKSPHFISKYTGRPSMQSLR
jgi:hypothetical protein